MQSLFFKRKYFFEIRKHKSLCYRKSLIIKPNQGFKQPNSLPLYLSPRQIKLVLTKFIARSVLLWIWHFRKRIITKCFRRIKRDKRSFVVIAINLSSSKQHIRRLYTDRQNIHYIESKYKGNTRTHIYSSESKIKISTTTVAAISYT